MALVVFGVARLHCIVLLAAYLAALQFSIRSMFNFFVVFADEPDNVFVDLSVDGVLTRGIF